MTVGISLLADSFVTERKYARALTSCAHPCQFALAVCIASQRFQSENFLSIMFLV